VCVCLCVVASIIVYDELYNYSTIQRNTIITIIQGVSKKVVPPQLLRILSLQLSLFASF